MLTHKGGYDVRYSSIRQLGQARKDQKSFELGFLVTKFNLVMPAQEALLRGVKTVKPNLVTSQHEVFAIEVEVK